MTAPSNHPLISVKQLIEHTPEGCDPWLTAEAVAALCGLTQSWLSSAREGRKGILGPRFVKLGSGRTAIIRYRYSAVTEWMSSFEEFEMTMGRASPYDDGRDWLKARHPEKSFERWPFTILAGRLCEFFLALPHARTADHPISRVYWLTREEYCSGVFERHPDDAL